MSVVNVKIKISELLDDLRSGLTWYAKDGNSIQEKYGMEDEDVDMIKTHPVFQKPIRVFTIIDDVTKPEELSSAAPAAKKKAAKAPEAEATEEIATQHAIEEFEAAKVEGTLNLFAETATEEVEETVAPLEFMNL